MSATGGSDEELQRLQIVFDKAPIGKALVSHEGRIVLVNEAFCAVTGRSREELLGIGFEDMTHPDDLAVDQRYVTRLIERREGSYQIQKRLITPDGSVVQVLLAVAFVRGETPEQDYFIAQSLNIDEQAAAEAAQRLALEHERELVTQLRELDRTKSNFLSTVSHEFRTPLTSALGYLELLTDGAAGELSAQQSAMVAAADRGTRRLLELIEDLLVLSQIETGTRVGTVEELDVSELIADAIEELGEHAVHHGVVFDVEVGGPLPVAGRRIEVRRALVHLVHNAVKFSTPGSSVHVQCHSDGDDAVVQVVDHGPGIPVEDQATLFHPFTRPNSTFDAAVPGLGIGLALAGELVQLNGGSVELASSPGVGTVVTVRLPLSHLQLGDGDRSNIAATEQPS